MTTVTAIPKKRILRKVLVGRKVLCSHCGRRTVLGKIGTFHKVMFIFCAACIEKDAPGCLKQMRGAASIER